MRSRNHSECWPTLATTTGRSEQKKTLLDLVNNACWDAGQHEVTCAHAQRYAHPVCVWRMHSSTPDVEWSARAFRTLVINYVQQVKLHRNRKIFFCEIFPLYGIYRKNRIGNTVTRSKQLCNGFNRKLSCGSCEQWRPVKQW